MRERINTFLRHGLIRNIMALSGARFAGYLFPLVTVPYLTRVLGPTAWGLVAFAWAFGQYVVVLVEYGFDLSATREGAVHRDSRDRLADLLAGVLGAKVLLALLAIGLALLVQPWIPNFREYPALLWASIFFALGQSFSLAWYYQGLERIRLLATLEISAKASAMAGIFLFVRSPEDGWKVLALQGLASFLAMAVALGLAYSEVPFRLPSLSLIWKALQVGWPTFVSGSAISLYTAGNAFILGLFAPPQFVGYYAGAEKISSAFLGLLQPVNQVLYPRLSYLAHYARDQAVRLARIALVILGTGGMLMGLLIFLLAPFLVHGLLGEEFGPAVPVLRILALLPPLVASSTVLGIYWMLPLRMERPLNVIALGAGLVNLVLALLLAPRYAQLGMAWAVVAAELFVFAGIYLLLYWRGLNPLINAEHKKD